MELLLVDDALYLLQGQISCDGDDGKFIFFLTHQYKFLFFVFVPFQICLLYTSDAADEDSPV